MPTGDFRVTRLLRGEWIVTSFVFCDRDNPTSPTHTLVFCPCEPTVMTVCAKTVVAGIMSAMPPEVSPYDSVGGDKAGVLKFWYTGPMSKHKALALKDIVVHFLEDNRNDPSLYVARPKILVH